MSISKRLRFEILNRDAFTCRYCGRKAPDVVLEVDHVHPRSLGGKDIRENLVTACYGCNRGKTASVIVHAEPPAGFMAEALDRITDLLHLKNSWDLESLEYCTQYPHQIITDTLNRLSSIGEVKILPNGRFYVVPNEDDFGGQSPDNQFPEWWYPEFVKPIPWSRERVESDIAGLAPSPHCYTMASDACARIAEAFS